MAIAGSRCRYTPTSSVKTFHFPELTPEQEAAIATAAKNLHTLRNNWLNPPEWTKMETLEFPGSIDGPWKRYVHDAGARRDWYAPDEQLSNEDLIAERYRGIRPAFGYPACPDHVLKRRLFDLVGAREIGMELSETGAMLPAASVSGIYLAHPAARYFNVGRIGKDQVEDYARRLGESVTEAERWLRPNLAYDPD